MRSTTAFLAALSSTVVAALNPNCAPGGNFDLSIFNLQLPTGSQGNVDTIPASQLKGCGGYQDSGHHYFFTESGDGALVMKVPAKSSGCVTTSGSTHCRTELREISPSSWNPNSSTNRLRATLAVESADNTCVGQIHIDDSISSKPVAELYVHSNGDIVMGVEQTRSGGNQVPTTVGNVPLGTQFSYEIRYEKNVLSVSINGGSFKTLSTYDLDAPNSYFKVGNYDQSDSAADIHFFAIEIDH